MEAPEFPTTLSDEVEAALAEVLGEEQDELDLPDFDPVEYINRRFPDEDSLAGLDACTARFEAEIKALEKELHSAVREQALAAAKASQDLSDARGSISDLVGKVADIKAKAEKSEDMVQDICRDIKALDVAKRHLTNTIETLNRVQMLVTSVYRLEAYVEVHEYTDAGRLLEAVQQLFKLFAPYKEVPSMRNLMERVDTVKVELQHLIEEEFEDLTDAGAGEAASLADPEESEASGAVATSLETLRHACGVIDALGGKVLERLIGRLCRKQLNKPYERTFGGADAASLDAVERRYAWFRRQLRDVEARFGRVLPRHWSLPHRLAVAFADKVRADIGGKVLSAFDPPDSAPAEALVRALNKTLQWEKEMTRRFEKEGTIVGEAAEGQAASAGAGAAAGPAEFDESAPLVNEAGEVVDPTSAEGIRLKYKRRQEWKAAAQAREAAEAAKSSKAAWLSSLAGGAGDVAEAESLPALPTLMRRISDVFDPYMGAYVALERGSLDAIVMAAGEEARGVGEGAAAGTSHAGSRDVLMSSAKLFLQIKNATSRCVQLGRAQTLFELYIQFKEALGGYARALESGVPEPVVAKAASALSFGASTPAALPGDTYSIGQGTEGIHALKRLASVINTAEYVGETLPGLEESLRGKVDEAFSEAVSFSDTQDLFFGVAAKATKVLGEALACALDPALLALQGGNWWTLADVGDLSAYVSTVDATLRKLMPPVRQVLRNCPGAFRSFCDKFARAFTARYMGALFNCKRIGEMGAQQLLLDAQGIKSVLLDAPALVGEGDDGDSSGVGGGHSVPTVYKNFVSREMPRIELLLKLVSTPEARFAASIQALWPSATAPELSRIMDLRAMPRRTQSAVLAELRLTGGGGGKAGGENAFVAGMSSMVGGLRDGGSAFAKALGGTGRRDGSGAGGGGGGAAR
ncbi:VPS53 [Symbiodinium sp. KB8]|nr:VPS53 [Symbiodinium sp. KB8]